MLKPTMSHNLFIQSPWCWGSSLSSQPHYCYTDEVYEVLISLHPKKAAGVDDIGPRILQSSASALVLPLYHLFCYYQIPAKWKLHSIMPVYKSGDKTLANNYCPIFLLYIVSKVLEKLIYNQMF